MKCLYLSFRKRVTLEMTYLLRGETGLRWQSPIFFPTPQRYAEVLGKKTVSARRLTEFWGRETADISEYEKTGSAMNAILTFKPVKGKRVHFHERIA